LVSQPFPLPIRVSASFHWNNSLWPLIITHGVDARTLAVGLLVAFRLFQRQFVQRFMRANIQ
jgi:ABC-type glycerol-3-phosphate transport system permease component